MKCAVIVFPGSNCDADMLHALELLGHTADYVWHKSGDLSGYDFVALPGGFSYGDYLRSGAIARFSPIMQAIVAFARSGKPVMGVCNGLQILVEAGLLPGALMRNKHLRFLCKHVYLRAENTSTSFTRGITATQPLKIPIAHGEGQFYADSKTLQALNDNGQVVFRYVDENNQASIMANPNGSVENIAGIINKQGNVLGMMPHPERAMEKLLGSDDGRQIFESMTA